MLHFCDDSVVLYERFKDEDKNIVFRNHEGNFRRL